MFSAGFARRRAGLPSFSAGPAQALQFLHSSIVAKDIAAAQQKPNYPVKERANTCRPVTRDTKMAYATHSHGFASLGERALDLMGRVAGGMARRRAFHQTMRELEALSDRDLTDLGICRADIREVAQRAVFGRTSI